MEFDNLFYSSPNLLVAPTTLTRATVIATKILRSSLYRGIFATMYAGQDTKDPIANMDLFDRIVNKTNLIELGRIRYSSCLHSRALVSRERYPWLIMFNPLLLMEMIDREREAAELDSDPRLIAREDVSAHAPRPDDPDNPTRYQVRSLAVSATVEARAEEDSTTHKMPRKVHSEVVTEKHILMLAILLVHESSHLINYQVYNNLVWNKGQIVTPTKVVDTGRGRIKLNDFGHMIEWELFGYVIQHVIDQDFPAPFALKHIIGCCGQDSCEGFIVSPSHALRQLIQGDDSIEINADALRLVPGEEFRGTSATFKIVSSYRGCEAPPVLSLNGVVVEVTKNEDQHDFGNHNGVLQKRSSIQLHFGLPNGFRE